MDETSNPWLWLMAMLGSATGDHAISPLVWHGAGSLAAGLHQAWGVCTRVPHRTNPPQQEGETDEDVYCTGRERKNLPGREEATASEAGRFPTRGPEGRAHGAWQEGERGKGEGGRGQGMQSPCSIWMNQRSFFPSFFGVIHLYSPLLCNWLFLAWLASKLAPNETDYFFLPAPC